VRLKQYCIHLILCVAILSATISPACAFISGKGGDWIEICSTGILSKTIQSDTLSEAPDMNQNGCEFCFHFLKMNGIENTSISLNLEKHPVFIGGFQNEIALIQYHSSHKARAPPALS